MIVWKRQNGLKQFKIFSGIVLQKFRRERSIKMSVERIGVATTERIINQMGLIFREQPTDDYGIDAQIETIEEGYPTGKLIAVQIKSGESFFSEITSDSIIYRGERKHYDYWLNHSLPVIIVLYDPTNDECYWNVVNPKTATLTKKNWKIEIPFSNLLKKAKSKLFELADNLTEYEKKFNTFLFAKPWMKEIIIGNKIVLNVEEWINKTSGRGDFKLRIFDKNGVERQVFNQSFWGFGLKPYPQVFKELFPWASITIDADYYDEYDDEAIENRNFEAAMHTYPESVGATFNRETFEFIYPKIVPSIENWMKDERNIRPYCIGGGEVAFYQLVLELNEVAKSFLVLDDFINDTKFYTFSERTFR